MIRNPVKNEDGSINVELEHPDFGWIPFTAREDDCEDYGKFIYQQLINGEYGEINESSDA